MAELKRPKIGLALGSGGSRGLAHIGVIKALEENNIPIDFIAGSSIGAMIGGFYAARLDIKEIEEIALSINWRRIFSILFDPHLKQGLIGGEKLKTFIKNYINGKKFEDCKIPFAAVATDLKTGEIVILNKGEINVGKNYWYQFTNAQDKILAGEKAAKEVLPQLKELIYQKSKGSLKKYLRFLRDKKLDKGQ